MAKRTFSRNQFARLVDEALASLPQRFADRIENVVIAIEDEPTVEDYEILDDGEDELLGIYRGIPLTERGHDGGPLVPDEIAIFQGPIERVARTRADVIKEVRETVVHELGHYFGLDDDEMPF
jgi:predicted Zn-dependent protease with MMP-like domain